MASWKNATGSGAGLAGCSGPRRPCGWLTCAATTPSLPSCSRSSSGTGRCAGTAPGQAPFRSEVLSHPSVNVSVESGTEPRFGHELPAVLVHGVVTRRFVVDLVGRRAGDRGEVPTPAASARSPAPCPARNSVTRLGAELGVPASTLLRDVLAEDDDQSRVRLLDAALAPCAPEPPASYLELLGSARRAWRPTAGWSAWSRWPGSRA